MRSMNIYGNLPLPHPHEQQQFRTLTKGIKRTLPYLGDWVVLLANFTYRHSSLQEIENDYDWDGQFDAVLLAERHIVIYELKAKPGFVRGWTDAKDWQFRYPGSDEVVYERSCFDQISKQRVYFLRNFLDKQRDIIGVEADMSFDVDARLVFPRNTRLDVRTKLPRDMNRKEFEEVTLPSIQEPELRALMASSYAPSDGNPDKVYVCVSLDRERIQGLKRAFAESLTPLRVERWFRAIRTSEISKDLVERCGSDEMVLSRDNAMAIVASLGLVEVVAEMV